ncbi:butyrophilin subfamily 1 member A1-like [Neosynchiropus ocellatus]
MWNCFQYSSSSLTGVEILLFLVSLLRAALSGQQPVCFSVVVTVYSRYGSDQVLPCRFSSGDDPLVHWYKGRKDLAVHSYHRGQDQLAHQMDEFRGRTSLFHDQLSRGNASLLLKEVQVSDRGRYTCFTSNSRGRQESSVNLEVEAPVTKVSIVQEGDTITCRAEGIYPEPQVTWSRNKPADTRIEQTEQQLYNIRSSVRADGEGDSTCHIRTFWSSRSATLTTARAEATLDCPALKPPLTSVTWRFNDGIIVQSKLIISERWRDHVKGLSMSRRLTLQTLSPDLSGIYTCEVTNEEETHVKIICVTVADGQNSASERQNYNATPETCDLLPMREDPITANGKQQPTPAILCNDSGYAVDSGNDDDSGGSGDSSNAVDSGSNDNSGGDDDSNNAYDSGNVGDSYIDGIEPNDYP